jgi:hypothetical protein
MDRAATDVAKPPAGGADLPSFEELLAKGSFHARLARARAEREKVLAEAGDDGFILDTRRKPWEKQDAAGDQGGPLTRVLQARKAMEAGRSVVTPLRPERRRQPVAERRERPSAEVLLLRPSAAIGMTRLRPGPSLSAPGPRTAATAHPAATTLRQDPPARTQAPTPSRVLRALMAGSGFATGLSLGVAATAILPHLWAGFTAAPPPPPVIAAADPQPMAPPAAPADPAGSIAVASAPVSLSRPEPPPPIAEAPRDTAPAPAAASSGRATGAGPAQPEPPDAGETPASLPAVAGLAPSAPIPASALHPTGSPDLAPLLAGPGAPPVVPGGRSAMSAGEQTLAAGPGDAPAGAHPLALPEVPALADLVLAAAADAPPGPPELPPAVGPRFSGPVVLNAPASVGDAELAALVEGLGAGGFVLAEPNRVDITISESNVRYFHAADAAAAMAVATELGAEARDFTAFSPAPPAGTIEVWLAGRGSGAAPVRTRRASGQPSVSAADRELNALRARILQQLRNGDHL